MIGHKVTLASSLFASMASSSRFLFYIAYLLLACVFYFFSSPLMQDKQIRQRIKWKLERYAFASSLDFFSRPTAPLSFLCNLSVFQSHTPTGITFT